MRVLFVCTHNRCRSILAEALTRELADPSLSAASAGSAPAGEVHPLTLHYLQEARIATAGLASKSLDKVRSFDPHLVITLCDSAAGEACPLWLGNALRIHWGLADPSRVAPEQVDGAFAACMATLRERISLLAQLAGEEQDRAALSAALQAAGATLQAG